MDKSQAKASSNYNSPLTSEDKELLLSSRRSQEFKVLLKALKLLCESQEKAILTSDLRVITDRELAFLKARAEGAQKLIRDLAAFVENAPKANSES